MKEIRHKMCLFLAILGLLGQFILYSFDKKHSFEYIPNYPRVIIDWGQVVAQANQSFYDGDFVRARGLYTQVVNQNENRAAKIVASFTLAEMCLSRLGGAADYPRAQALYEFVADQNENRKMKASAQLALGNMYFKGVGMPVDNALARHYFSQAANQDENRQVREAARAHLAEVPTPHWAR